VEMTRLPTLPTRRATSSARARSRMLRPGERPMFFADWDEVLFVHFAVDPEVLQPHVPFDLDLFDGRAYVSVVAFTQRDLRPRIGGRLAAIASAPLAEHEFLNVRTYVRHGGGHGIYFLAEWIPNRLAALVGPPMYGLPYRLGRLRYASRKPAADRPGRYRAQVVAPVGRMEFEAEVDAGLPLRPARRGLETFLLERYTAFTRAAGVDRRFRVWHAPWRCARARVALRDATLLRAAFPWLAEWCPAMAHYSPGVRDVWIGPPRRLAAQQRKTPMHTRTTDSDPLGAAPVSHVSRPVEEGTTSVAPATDDAQRTVRAVKRIARTALGLVWVYEGLVPKILFTTQMEVDLVERSGLYWPTPYAMLITIGVCEIAGGIWLLTGRGERLAAALSVALLLVLGTLCAALAPDLLYHPFGGLSKNFGLIACAAAVYLLSPLTRPGITRRRPSRALFPSKKEVV
jgi:uncharacterized protein YqjF (DUF2071 family)/uncharacterized membrane protein YphA (DoxX/SURF4 family)